MIDIVTNDNNKDTFWIPINRYILDTFKDANNDTKPFNRYHININQIKESNVLIELSAIYDDIKIEFENSSNIYFNKDDNSAGFQKYRIVDINRPDDDVDKYNIYLKVYNTKDQNANANYMIRYYYSKINNEYEYNLDKKTRRFLNGKDDKEVNVTFTLDGIKIKKGESKTIEVANNDIYFFITSILYKSNPNSSEIINSTSMLMEHEELAKNETILAYNSNEEWNISFYNFSRKNNFKCDLQIRVNILNSKDLFNEQFLVFKDSVDLTDIKSNKATVWIIVGSVLGAIVLALIIFFIVKYVKLRKKNANLKYEMMNMAFSNNVQKNVLFEENKISKNDSDYETTFI